MNRHIRFATKIAADEATDGVHGMVAAKDLGRGTADDSVVEVPVGEALAVEPRDVRERPTPEALRLLAQIVVAN